MARRVLAAVVVLMATATTPSRGQEPLTAHVSAQGILAGTFVNRVPGGKSRSEAKLEQDIVSLSASFGDHLRFDGTLDFEGLTMPGGVLTLGGWGEGFLERRHPHTYAHELMWSAVTGATAATRVSLSVGKGFVPFGTDDPMNRPALRFPVNHHWSQVIERAQLAGGFRFRAVTVEGSVFNGDEPESPGQWPLLSRFGDSWSVRLSAAPAEGVELQASRASVKSPEYRAGAGTVQGKWNVSARVERMLSAGTLYALGEWARNEEAAGFFRFDSWLVEGALSRGSHRPYYRFELTERPEEERTLDLFRSLRPHLENTIIGISRWQIHTVGYGRTFSVRSAVVMEPIVEVSHASVEEIGGGLFNVANFFGRSSLWSVTVALRMRTPGTAHRMGKYGVSAPPAHHH